METIVFTQDERKKAFRNKASKIICKGQLAEDF